MVPQHQPEADEGGKAGGGAVPAHPGCRRQRPGQGGGQADGPQPAGAGGDDHGGLPHRLAGRHIDGDGHIGGAAEQHIRRHQRQQRGEAEPARRQPPQRQQAGEAERHPAGEDRQQREADPAPHHRRRLPGRGGTHRADQQLVAAEPGEAGGDQGDGGEADEQPIAFRPQHPQRHDQPADLQRQLQPVAAQQHHGIPRDPAAHRPGQQWRHPGAQQGEGFSHAAGRRQGRRRWRRGPASAPNPHHRGGSAPAARPAGGWRARR